MLLELEMEGMYWWKIKARVVSEEQVMESL